MYMVFSNLITATIQDGPFTGYFDPGGNAFTDQGIFQNGDITELTIRVANGLVYAIRVR